MKVLIITNLFPNHLQPERGIFNKQQFLELAKLCEIRVVAPLPWCPPLPFETSNSLLSKIKNEETIEGLKVYHPRYAVIPKLSQSFNGKLLYFGIKDLVKKIQSDFDFDIILSTWAYPDCYAAYLVAKDLNKRLVCKVHGTDINVGLENPIKKKQILESFAHASQIIAVSSALKEKIVALGIAQKKVVLLPNGIDKGLFKPLDKNECRQKLNLDKDKKYVLFIGNLVEIKGVDYLVEAFKNLDDSFCLNVVGDGELSSSIKNKIADNKLEGRILLKGRRPHQEIPLWLNASDVLCLPSLNEGCPNVIVEALGCQKNIVATKVGAIPELLQNYPKSILVNPKDSLGLTAALKNIFLKPASPTADADVHLSWQENAKKLYEVLKTNST